MFDSLGISYIREFTISFTGYARRCARVDFLLTTYWGWTVLEVDERSHAQYSIKHECNRMEMIFGEFAKRHPGSRLHIIRFNPDAYKHNGMIIKPPTREAQEQALRHALEFVPFQPLTISYLFYRRGSGGTPEVTQHSDYSCQGRLGIVF